MIRLQQQLFRRAVDKARNLKPTVIRTDLGYAVRRSDNGLASVRFVARDNAIWAMCDCPAHKPTHGPARAPLPCYHIAAALLWALEQRKPAHTPAPSHHYHECDTCGRNYPCPAPGCAEIHTLACDSCDAREADAIAYNASFWN